MKIRYKKLNPDAKTPYKKHGDDFCYDLYASTDAMPVYDENGNRLPNVWKYGTGIAFEIVRDSELISEESINEYYCRETTIDFSTSPLKLSIDARPRSSVFKTGLLLCNCTGTIDEPYRGEVCAFFYDVIPQLPNYKKGDRIVQVKVGVTFPVEWEEVDELSDTNRGEGGFGSTGK
jgi:dUTP pyrophosphatase